ncbi:protein FAR1-RELATED SEQUENCE 5-like [Papaver somniferum]|uniref:protein FAR1-RELATED SEQUENCE 5-like n=1 Tax=Papaver somniferum TaxID=3469 RepID=UPI000E6F779C|nr:protein FAR1-RELATED SEQUENCE 5-like [Papaver somniferum]
MILKEFYEANVDIAPRGDSIIEVSKSCNVSEDEGDIDGNYSNCSKDSLGFESDCEMVNEYCEKVENHETREIFSDGIETRTKEDPKIGMIFDTIDEAYEYYNIYARKVGFSVRIQRTNRNRTEKIRRQLLVCNCEGSYRKVRTPKKKRAERRFGCKAMFEIKLCDGDKYEKFSYMREESGCARNLNFTRIDSNNFIHRIKRLEFFKKGDAQCLLDYFKKKKQENKHFFYCFRTNEDGETRGVFFCDAQSRRDYALFGDAVCFDTTFRTKNYNMLCAPIVGINNHGQTTLFGCGLIDGESTDAVVWLFNTFMEAMEGKRPVSIFSDQAPGILKAVEEVFPDSHHGLCLWHISQNAAKHLGKTFSEYKSFASDFKSCIYDPETIDEFEKNWKKMLEDYKLTNNEWLQGIYDLREKWAQVYSHSYFCAGITTTQRSESINKFLKSYFSREAAKFYTRKMFSIFQEELKLIVGLLLEMEKEDGGIRIYKAKDIDDMRRIRTLTYNSIENSVSCSCRKFEFSGILCAHALKVFHDLQYKNLPPQYYLKRWSKKATNEVVFDASGDLIPNDNDPSATQCYSELSHISQRIVSKCCSQSKELFDLTKLSLLRVEQQMEAHIRSLKEQESNVPHSTSNAPTPVPNVIEEEVLRDPQKKISKGQSRKRIKGPFDTGVPKNSVKKGRTVDEVTMNQLVYNSEGLEASQGVVDHQRLLLHSGSLLTQQAARSQNSTSIGTSISTTKRKPRICKTCDKGGHDTRNCPRKKEIGKLGIGIVVGGQVLDDNGHLDVNNG